MRAVKETFQLIRSKVTKFDPELLQRGHESVLPTEPQITEQPATTVFDHSIRAKNPRHLDNHLNSHKPVVKVFESAPKLR